MVTTIPGRPKGLPPVWNLFQRRNIHFVGRQQNLRDLEEAFAVAGHRPQVLAGGGGCGKTALAIEYAYAHQEKYDIVWWIRAESQATISADLAALAPKLARSGQIFDGPRQACSAVMEELQSRDRWLLIFDNARQPDDLAGYLPAQGAGDVLITSTNFHWRSVGKVQAVNAWARQESIEFLRRRLGGIDEPYAADQLAAALGDLPLALEQAAACIEQADILLSQYLNDYESLWAEMLGQGRPLGSYPMHVAMTWELSFRRVESLNPMAAQLLTLCGFFSPDEIPLSMLENGAGELPPELAYGLLDPGIRGEAMNLLERFSLATTGDGIVSIHGVIAAMAQDRLHPADRMNWAQMALRIASAAFSFDSQNPNSWHACAAVLPHAMCSTMCAQGMGIVPAEVVDMLSRIGRFLLKQGNYSEARGLLEMAYTLVMSTYGPQSTQAADIANNLARVRHRLGDLAGASTLYEAALEIDRLNYGPDDPHLATVANNSAMTLVELGRLGQAKERFEWAIGVFGKSYPKNHPKIASVMNNLGFVLTQLKDHETARQWLEQSLTITESTFGANHPQVACIAVNLGAALRAQGRQVPARKLFDRALLIDQTAFGAHHPAVARDLLNLAQLLSDQGNFDEAVRLLERALTITESSFGSQHRETVLCLRELGRALKGTGDAARAVDCMMRASAIMGKPAQQSHETIVGDEGMLA
ncbi:MAG: FxSxx-COOH system tetratricopeptide repeat protein [Tepidisphaeraceae bacterium]|jgi:tetratricopeptide (TPR) repeat protein